MTGDVREFGVYAVKVKGDVLHEFARDPPWSWDLNDEAVVLGKVELWGEVVEHEDGYRAEFAAINSLDDIILVAQLVAQPYPVTPLQRPLGLLARLQNKYTPDPGQGVMPFPALDTGHLKWRP
jgi:hypothetical protein